MRKWIGFFLVGLILFSCSGSKNMQVSDKSEHMKSSEYNLSIPLDSAQIYLELAEAAELQKDTSAAELYFEKAMNISANFKMQHSGEIDSTSQRIIEEISSEYSQYLARLSGLEEDSLSAANVMELLNELDEFVIEDSITTFITIDDVIDNAQQMAIPLILNKKVENAICYFQGRGRRVFTRWLQRSGWYRDLIHQILHDEGVPEELFYLAMIESGFNPHARSYARAVGIWQFIYGTGKAYGLKSSWWYDDRRDPEKSSRAAAKHLKNLYERFNNWYLAIAGYNYSPAKIERRMKKYQVEEFWDLPRLPRQTRNYVPTFIAAVHIAKNPEDYGFYIEPEPPIVYDTVTVKECVDLNVVAECVGNSFKEIKKLNPALIRWCTPPDKKSWVLNVPKGTRNLFIENYSKIPDDKKFTYIHHRIRRGETLSEISRKYGINIWEIKRFNKIRGTLIREGHYLVIPYPQNKQYASLLAKTSSRNYSTTLRSNKPVKNVPGKEKYVHVVSQGETLWDIATFYGVSISEVKRWNGFRSSRIYPQQQINIWLSQEISNKKTNPKNQSTSTTLNENNEETQEDKKTIIYIVRDGDTLWDIASRYQVSIRDLKRWNNKSSNLIKPGDELKIITSQ